VPVKKPQETERQFQKAVIDLAKACGWMVMHSRPARVKVRGKETWRTPLQGDAGFPDLVLARDAEELLLVELKRTGQKRREDQLTWAEEIPRENYRLWWPFDWPEIEKTLTTRSPRLPKQSPPQSPARKPRRGK
jgi:VRR-NUC domain-containing protein